ncbi:nascent polypeptide-associated complex subunit alpha, muscle-specific form isoform X2 [Pseudoliparis swirei]|nr:nascent polypeptide-associated complex subunit alpha, muscle-specific form isoform X2 [Pseudoliparis swirei]
MASERCHVPLWDRSAQASECASLSQHPLAQATILSEGVSGCCSLSQHSLSLMEEGRREGTVQSPPIATTERPGVPSRGNASSREKDFKTHTDPPDEPTGEAAEDDTFFLSKDIAAQHLLKLLQKDIGMPSSSSSSAVSSTSETSVKAAASYAEQPKSTKVGEAATDRSTVRREGPPGEASLPQTQQPDKDLSSDRSRTSSSNVTTGFRSTRPDDSSEDLRRELLREVERRGGREAGAKKQRRKSLSVTPYPTAMSEGEQSATRRNAGGPQRTGGVERGHSERDHWFSGSQTGIDGSYLGFLPQSQSTPGVFKAPPKSNATAKFGQLSAIESNNNSSQSNTEISPAPDVHVADVHPPDKENLSQEEVTSAKVQSLPSLNYMQKVDAWRANQSSGNKSLFDSSALRGFFGISPKKKAHDAEPDPLNQMLSQQVRSLQPPAVSSAVNQHVTESSSSAPSGSPPGRGEAAGGAPSDRDAAGSAARPSGRSPSRSSPSTGVTSGRSSAEEESGRIPDDVLHRPSAAVQPPPPRPSLGAFSDVSLDPDLTLSSSQDGYDGGMKLGTGASSVVSLEVDNYAPHWTSKRSTPPPLPRRRELNIEERIPLYLRNLGIDQSPSTILTPFAPRGPIREPEFSPTDLCTIKGSVGTPTKSTQTSEGSSPQKRDFSGCSVLSVDSSVSVTLSLDSLGAGVSLPDWTRHTEPFQSQRSLAPSSLPDEDSHPSARRQHIDSSLTSGHGTVLPGPSESPSQTSRGSEQSAELSLVGSAALCEIHKLLSQMENVVSAGSSEASSSEPAAPRLLSDNRDVFLSPRRNTGGLRDPSSSSSSSLATEEPGTRLWARSTSDSTLTSERLRNGSIGGESATSLGRPNNSPARAAPTVGAHRRPQDGAVGRGSDPSVVLSQSARRRAEPEGCSAAPPDDAAPPQPPVLTPTPADTEGGTHTAPEGPAWSGASSPSFEDTDPGATSDGSSRSSLAIRVVKLLQSDSPATLGSSTSSTTEQEQSNARERIKLRSSGRQCEPLELDKEDRKRIEEIKRELLLKNPMKSLTSTDTESSSGSSVRVLNGPDAPRRAGTPLGDPDDPPSLSMKLSVPPQNPLRPDPEARVQEIAAREQGTSITSCRRSTSPSPSTSPAPPPRPAPEPLLLAELSAGEEDGAAREPPPVFEPSRDPTPPLSAPGSPKRRDAVGGRPEEPPPPGFGGEDVNAEDDDDYDRSVQDRSVSGAGHEAQQATGHVRLAPSPKAADRSPAVDAVAAALPPRKEFALLRHSPAASSPGEGVGLSGPPERYDARGPGRQRAPERAETTSTRVRTAAALGRTTSTPRRRAAASQRPPAVPVLLPYKPRGSEELFYMPQAEADASSVDPSDTTMESSHTGSDDAVPPRFSSEVLGLRDAGSDRGVTIRHSEGVYSKRLNTGRMTAPGGASVSTDGTSPTTRPPAPQPPSRVSGTRGPLSGGQRASKRDQGTGPVHFPSPDPPEPGQERRDSGRPPPAALDQLWESFCERWSPEEARPPGDREASLLERLERLSRLIGDSRSANQPHRGEGGKVEGEPPTPLQRLRVRTSSPPPADEDESEASSGVSGSVSTVDTARLVRAFGADRVQHLKTSAGLRKLYGAIAEQKEGSERRGRGRETPPLVTPSETTGTEESTVAADSTTPPGLPPPRGPSRTLAAKKAVKRVSRGIQAGGVELVGNGTRRRTRDVGTTFPSPQTSSSSLERGGRGGWRSPSKSQGSQKQRKSKRSPAKTLPEGVSWFISADDLRSEERKENRPEEEERPWSAWFEPYGRIQPWREPLRPRPAQEDGNRQAEPDPGPRTKRASPGLTRISLQEALEMRRPEFISQSRQRVMRLALQAEERNLQEVFRRERHQLFGRPGGPARLPNAGAALLRRAVPRKEMIQRSKQIYESLPEVQSRREEERRRTEYRSYRLNAQLFNKRITSRVLSRRRRRAAWPGSDP